MCTTIALQEQETKSKLNHFEDISIVCLTLIYSYLFYEQDYGINYLILSVIVLGIFIFRDRTLVKNWKFMTIALSTLITGCTTFYFGTCYHVSMNKISLLLLLGLVASLKSSLIVVLINSIYSYIVLPLKMFINLVTFQFLSLSGYGKAVKYILLTIFPLIIAAIFFGIYSFSNPILAEYVSKFNWNFVSVFFLLFLFYSFLISYGVMKPSAIVKLKSFDESTSDSLSISENKNGNSFLGFLSIHSEIYIAMAVFILLNLVIGLNNGIDIYYLFIEKTLPKGLSHTSFLHQSVNSLILSIFLAIALIMYFFSSRLNFVKSANYIKMIAYAWIAQNFVLAVLCLYKNIQYVDQFGLTYKRLGVYTFLFLAAIGLGLTFYKILKNKTNLFLIRKNTWIAYIVLVLLGCFDWDYIITYNNIHSDKDSHIDYNYLTSLDHTGLPLLQKHLFKDENEYYVTKKNVNYGLESWYQSDPKHKVIIKIENFKNSVCKDKWQSYCVSKSIVNNKLITSKIN